MNAAWLCKSQQVLTLDATTATDPPTSATLVRYASGTHWRELTDG